MKLPTAKKAKQISKKINEQQTKGQLKFLRKALRGAIEEGNTYYRVSEDFCSKEILDIFREELKELGYITEYDDVLIERLYVNCLFIYWKD